MNSEDWHHMNTAFELAKKALADSEVPVGCVFVCDGIQLASGRNAVNRTKNPTRHAEMVALDALKLWCAEHEKNIEHVLKDCTLYVTLEPCIMCACALYHLQIKRIVYGATNERFGGIKSVANRELYSIEHTIQIDGNVDVERTIRMLKDFYEIENPFCPKEKRKLKTLKTNNVDSH